MQLLESHKWLILVGLILLGLFFRIYRLDHQSFWLDEIITIQSVQQPIIQIIFPDNNTAQPLYYLLLHPFLKTENREFWMRLPSAVFGTLSIFFLFLVLRDWLGLEIALFSSFIMSISPFHIWYSQEIRSYVLLVFMVLLSLWSYQNVQKKPANWSIKIGFMLSTAGTIYCHNVAIAYIALLFGYILICEKNRMKTWIPALSGITILITPVLYVLLTTSGVSADPGRPFYIIDIPYAFWVFSAGYSLGPSVAQLHFPEKFSYVVKETNTILSVLLIYGSLFLYGIIQLWKSEKKSFLLIILLMGIPILSVILGTFITNHTFNVRYVIISFIPYIAIVSAGIAHLKYRTAKILSVWFIIIISIISLHNYYFNPKYQRENTRAAAKYLEDHVSYKELIIISVPYMEKPLNYYLDDSLLLDLVKYPTISKYVDADNLPEDMYQILADHNQFWLFLSRTFHSDPFGYLKEYCDNYFKRNLYKKWSGIELIQYKKP